MNIDEAFEDLIRDISLSIGSGSTGTGFHPINCPMCKNANEKVKKGGFKFESDKIIYNCFKGKCDATVVYEKGSYVPRKFRDLLDRLGVKVPIALTTASMNRTKKVSEALDEDLYKKNSYKQVKFHDGIVPLDSVGGRADWFRTVIKNRCLLPYDFMYQTKGEYKDCGVIPIYFFDRLIGWEYYTKSGLYLNMTESTNILMSREKIIPQKVLIVEGTMDDLCFPNTVAVKRSSIAPEQAYHLRRCDVLVLPDRRSSKLYESAEKYGWKVVLPEWEVKDLNEAVCSYGRLATAQMICDNVHTVSTKAEVIYRRWKQ